VPFLLPLGPTGVQENLFFKKKPNRMGFLGFIGFFGFCCLNEQLGSLLVDLAHHLSFFIYIRWYFRLSKTLQIHYLLVVRSCKHEETFYYYWHEELKMNRVWCRFFAGCSTGFTQKTWWVFWVLLGCLNPEQQQDTVAILNKGTLPTCACKLYCLSSGCAVHCCRRHFTFTVRLHSRKKS